MTASLAQNGRRYFVAFWLAVLAVLLPVMAINVVIDGEDIYLGRSSSEVMASYAQQIRTSPHGIIPPTHIGANTRLFKRQFAGQVDAECVVIGASTVMTIGEQPRKNFLSGCASVANIFVPGANLEDLVILLAEIVDKPSLKMVMVDVGYTEMNHVRKVSGQEGDVLDRRFYGHFAAAAQRFGFPRQNLPLVWVPGQNLLSWGYLKSNLGKLSLLHEGGLLRPSHFAQVRLVNADASNVARDELIQRPDGSLLFSQSYVAEEHGRNYNVVIEPRLRPAHLRQFAKTVHDARTGFAEFKAVADTFSRRGVTMAWLLVPIHPNAWYRGDAQVMAEFARFEQEVRDDACRRGGKVVGAFDAAQFGIVPEDYADGTHLRSDTFDKVRTLPLNCR